MEDLATANLVRNRHLARPIADAAWGELYRQFAYKATWYGSQLASAPRWFPSSKTCSNCGSVHQNLDLSQRVFRCDTSDGGCGLVIDRDLNAAVNLAAWAEAEQRSAAQTPDPKQEAGPPTPVEGPALATAPAVVQPDPQSRQGRSRNRSALPQTDSLTGRPRRALSNNPVGRSTGFSSSGPTGARPGPSGPG
jgi:hypothetical protein